MPRIDELPMPGQAELRAKRGEPMETETSGEARGGLLRRLAAVGLGRRETGGAGKCRHVRPPVRLRPDAATGRAWPAMRQDAAAADGSSVRAASRPAGAACPRPEPVSEYAKRPAHHGLDPHGRQAPVHNSVDDDQLDIPAFLRRQAN